MTERVIPFIAIAIMASLMAWAFVHGLDLELDIRDAKTRHYMEGKIR